MTVWSGMLRYGISSEGRSKKYAYRQRKTAYFSLRRTLCSFVESPPRPAIIKKGNKIQTVRVEGERKARGIKRNLKQRDNKRTKYLSFSLHKRKKHTRMTSGYVDHDKIRV